MMRALRRETDLHRHYLPRQRSGVSRSLPATKKKSILFMLFIFFFLSEQKIRYAYNYFSNGRGNLD